MRPELPQAVVDPEAAGSVGVYLTNDWTGKRLSGSQWKGDLPPGAKQRYMDAAKAILLGNGWSLDAKSTKILMLTHKALAAEQGYEALASARNPSITVETPGFAPSFRPKSGVPRGPVDK